MNTQHFEQSIVQKACGFVQCLFHLRRLRTHDGEIQFRMGVIRCQLHFLYRHHANARIAQLTLNQHRDILFDLLGDAARALCRCFFCHLFSPNERKSGVLTHPAFSVHT